jgi:4-alpha-glucanotransferase
MARSSGVLLHPTSLPGPHGIGELGPIAYRFVDFLAAAGQTYWQILPLGPTGYGDSPYQTFSAFAGNALLINPDMLVEEGLLPTAALSEVPAFPTERVEYGAVIPYKRRLLEWAYAQYQRQGTPDLRRAVDDFVAAHRSWLAPFALFMALKDAHDGRPWTLWEPDIAAREPDALARWSARLEEQIQGHMYSQYLFFSQWHRLKGYAASKGIRIIGDAPIFVAHDSADCWAHRDLFWLQPNGEPALVAGVPPDYFSATGQLWGNPLYRWDVMAADGYQWWIDRLRLVLSTVDVLRLDHFRGFAGYWAIPGDAPTAEIGSWEPGPGIPFFVAVEKALGRLPIIAEDLGVITPDVVKMRDRFGFPGMRVLQFAFGSPEEEPDNPHLPHNHARNAIVYTGTHDNDTTAGWYSAASPPDRRYVRAYAHSTRADPASVAWDLVRMAQASVAQTAVVPLQDLLGLGSEARMNLPGRPGGNWQWRFGASVLTDDLAARVARLTRLFGRAPAQRTRAPITGEAGADEQRAVRPRAVRG